MKFITLVWLIMILSSCSGIQQNSKSGDQTQNDSDPNIDFYSGVQIESGPNLGLSYTDSLGIEYSHAHIITSFTNDSTKTLNLQLDLSRVYNFPSPHSDQKFKVIIWPQELVPNSDTISNELQNFLESGTDNTELLNISIEPNEKYIFTIGTLHLKSTNYYVSPGDLFVYRNGSTFSACENLINQVESESGMIPIGLKLRIPNVGCSIIACGHFSYSEH